MMRYAALAIFTFAVVLSCPAQDIPPGSYRDSCRSIKMHHDRLQAKCQTSQGNWVHTDLDDVDRCVGDITNVEGQLTCNKNGAPPQGSYMQTCRDVRARYNTLWARCETSNGQWINTSLDNFSQCPGGIVNIEGQLRCGGYGRDRDYDRDHDGDRDHNWRGGGQPRGSYEQSCRDISVQGDRLRARCQTSDGRWLDAALDDFDRCVGDIVNYEGRLGCTRRGGRSVPQGTYSQTCRQIYVDGDFLRAQCETRDGHWTWTQLNDWDGCRSGIVNLNGQLHCDR
jgi:CVNH domain